MEYKLKQVLNILMEIICVNKNEDTLKSYKKFSITLSKKEIKTNEKYSERNITVFNLYRNECELFNSLLIGLAHHIDFCDRGETDNKNHFMEIYTTLLYAALNNGFLEFDVLSMSDDYKKNKKIRDILSEYWPNKVYDSQSKLEIYNSFDMKSIMYTRKYSYDQLSRSWIKIIDNNEINNEIYYLQQVSSKFTYSIVPKNRVTIRFRCYIAILGKTYDYKNILKDNGYFFDCGTWKKNIIGNEYLQERKTILNLLPKGQGLKAELGFY